jgi:hypothetical protein
MRKQRRKRFSRFNLRDALMMIGTHPLKEWSFDVHPIQSSAHYQQTVTKLKSNFDLSRSEAAKSLLIDAILMEAVDSFDELKIWKGTLLQTESLTGVVDYLIAPQGTVYQSPLLCVVKPKKDDFEQGLAQCLMEMHACRVFNNFFDVDIYGIVTNATTWQFYKLTPQNEGYESPGYSETQLESILGILHALFTQCVANLKTFPKQEPKEPVK